MTGQKLILRLYFTPHITVENNFIFYCKTSIDWRFDNEDQRQPFLANNLQSIASKRCDRPLQWLTALCGREVRFRGLWRTLDTISQPKRVRSWLFINMFFLLLLLTELWSQECLRDFYIGLPATARAHHTFSYICSEGCRLKNRGWWFSLSNKGMLKLDHELPKASLDIYV